MSMMEYGEDGDAESRLTGVAVMTASENMGMLGLAIGADRAIRPADTLKKFDAIVFSWELGIDLYDVHRGILLVCVR